MAVEAKRGCGYRKIGGAYLVGGGVVVPCDRLPVPLDVCPCCGHGIKQSRGWTWVDVGKLAQGPHFLGPDGAGSRPACPEQERCPLCGDPESFGRAGLLWIGEQFYRTPKEFVAEGAALGFSRRVKAVPRGFKAGETWVLLAHPKAIEQPCANCGATGELPHIEGMDPLFKKCEQCGGKGFSFKPGAFYLWRPTGIEKILPESARGSGEVAELEKRGITPVFVPGNDYDHRGSAYDKPAEPGLFDDGQGPDFGGEG